MTHQLNLYAAVVTIWIAVITATPAYAYTRATIKNNSAYTVSGEVEYASVFCSDDDFTVAPNSSWTAPDSRGVCLITAITGKISGRAKNGENTAISTYTSSGTSYSQFQISGYGGQYRIFSNNEYAAVSKGEGKGPGFKIVNKTSWPIAYSLDQASCLHHGTVQANKNGKPGVDLVSTGGFWFTLRINIQPDGKDPVEKSSDCTKKFGENVGSAFVTVIGLPVEEGFYAVRDSFTKDSAKNSFSLSASNISERTKTLWRDYMVAAGTATLKGQFAGYEWPFRCDNMPEYHVTGGPEIVSNGGKLFFTKGKAFKVEKVNTCGDDMMSLSPKSITSDPSVPYATLSREMLNLNATIKSANLPKSGLITDGSYYWFLNGDGSRNWLQTAPKCASRAKKFTRSDIDAVLHKRHQGKGGYMLTSETYPRICAAKASYVKVQLVTNGSYYWLINADGTRNWLSSPPADCKAQAKPVYGNIDDHPKRAGGVNNAGYQLKGADLKVACDAILTPEVLQEAYEEPE